ncbi:MAG: hypothetical protein ACI4RP_00295, partial [Acutalibacteraceae bacterium]
MARASPHQSPVGDSFPRGGSLNSLQAFLNSKSRLRRLPKLLFILFSLFFILYSGVSAHLHS